MTDLAVEAPVTVVVAEHEAIIRLDIIEMLREHGYRVVSQTGNARVATALVRSLRPHLLILDQYLGMTGVGDAIRARARTLQPLAVVETSSGLTRSSNGHDASPGWVRIRKPFSEEDLLAAAGHALDTLVSHIPPQTGNWPREWSRAAVRNTQMAARRR